MPDSMNRIVDSIEREVAAERESGISVYPPENLVYKALELTSPTDVRCVIIGQDPYHGEGQANGLAFSVNVGTQLPPSLKNIFRELVSDIGCNMPHSGDLTPWAKNGVLLLNAILTVKDGTARSHRNLGWQIVTQEILQICLGASQPVVFLGWGRHAHKVIEEAKRSAEGRLENKTFLYSSHPSPLGVNKQCGSSPAFLGSRPFSRANEALINAGAEPIDWRLHQYGVLHKYRLTNVYT